MKKTIALVLSLLLLAGGTVSCRKEKENDLLTLKFNYDLSEYIDLAEYKGLPAEGYRFEVSDDAVAQQVLAARASYSRLTDVTRGAEWGDTLYVDYTADVEGLSGEEGHLEEEDAEMTLGAGSMFDAFEESLLGVTPESSLSLDLTFPDPYYTSPEYAGRNVHFEITVHEICEQELPAYTDDFVRAYLGYDSIAEYEKALRDALMKHYTENYYEFVADQVWTAVLDNTAVKKFPEAELDELYNGRLEFDRAYSEITGLNWDAYLELYYQITDEEYLGLAKEEAESRIKEEMVCFAIARRENITLSEAEYQEMAADYAKREGYASVEALEAVYNKDDIRETLMEDKVVRLIVDLADVHIEE